MTASASPIGSIDATSKPRSASFSAISAGGACTLTKSRTQETSNRMFQLDTKHEGTKKTSGCCFVMSCFRVLVRKLFQKPQIVLEEQPDVLYPVPEDCQALDAEAPGKAGVALRVVAYRFEHGRMHHAAAAQLDPPGPLAH